MGVFAALGSGYRLVSLLCLPKVVYQCVGQLVHWSAELMMQLPADQLTICQGKQHQHPHTSALPKVQNNTLVYICTLQMCTSKNSSRRQRVLRYFHEANIRY
jgi:hypothetical protein